MKNKEYSSEEKLLLFQKMNFEMQALILDLQKQKDLSSAIIETMGDATVVCNDKNIITDINQATLELLGYSSKESLVGKDVGMAIEEEEEEEEEEEVLPLKRFSLNHLLRQGIIKDTKASLKSFNELKIPVILSGKVLRGFKNEILAIVTVSKDIRLIKECIRKLKELDQARGRFIGIATHELRTPLSIIKSALSNVKAGIVSPEKVFHLLEIADKSINRMTAIITEVLDVTKIEAGKLKYHFKNVDFNEVAQKIYELFKLKMSEKGISLITEIPLDLPLIYADEGKIAEILVNLIENSFKFTPKEGKITLKVRSLTNGFLEVSISDSGCGIPPERIPHVFEKFMSSTFGSSTDVSTGTGLGLFLTKEFVQAHKGEIRVQSEAGKGTTFVFTLPYAQIPKILIVDDEKDFLDMMTCQMEGWGCEVGTALSGEEALEKIEKHLPSLIILDLRLSTMSGHELIGRLKLSPRTAEIPIIVMSAAQEEMDQAVKNNGDPSLIRILHKGIDNNELLKVFKQFLGEIRFQNGNQKNDVKEAA